MDSLNALLRPVVFVPSAIRSLWRRLRFGHHLRIGLDWQHAPIRVIDQPTTFWRAISTELVASKDSEYVIEGGYVEARCEGSDWRCIGPLTDFLQLPIVVPPNRRRIVKISAPSVARQLEKARSATSTIFELRVKMQDPHRVPLRSNKLKVSLSDLYYEKHSLL